MYPLHKTSSMSYIDLRNVLIAQTFASSIAF